MLDRLFELAAERREVLLADLLGLLELVGGLRELGAAVFERACLLGELGDAWGAGVFGEATALERFEIAFERGSGLAQLGLDGGELVLMLRPAFDQSLVGAVDRTAEQVLVGEDAAETSEDGFFELVGGEAVVASPLVVYEPVEVVFRGRRGARAVGERGAAAAGPGDS